MQVAEPSALANVSAPITKSSFLERGLAVTDWALERGFSPHLVYAILAGRRKCLRGQSYQIAKELGMK